MSDVQIVERAVPVTPAIEAVMRSPVHRQHVRLGCRFIREAGWELPAGYQATDAERQLIRSGLVIADVTARSKVDLRGSVDDLWANAPPPSNATFWRLSSTWALVIAPPGAIQTWIPSADEVAGPSTMVTDATSVYAGFALVGARVPDLLSRLTSVDPSRLEPGVALGMPLVKVPGIALRTERAVEVYVGFEYGRYAWESLLRIGHPLQLQPVGWEALRAEHVISPPEGEGREGVPGLP